MSAGQPQALSAADPARLRGIRFVLTDVDDTLTLHGRLPAATFVALDRLQAAGIKVIPVTAAPAGWADQMARMWPVDAVIAENGGLYFHARPQSRVPDLVTWHGQGGQAQLRGKLAGLHQRIIESLPEATTAADQPFRLTSLAMNRPADKPTRDRIIAEFREAGCSTTVNSLWVLGWFGDYDKLSMSRRLLAERFDTDLDRDRDAILYVGDSVNDEPMFAALPNTVGVSTVIDFLPDMASAPAWITQQAGGLGFAETANAILQAKAG